jgi:hypothetical protein
MLDRQSYTHACKQANIPMDLKHNTMSHLMVASSHQTPTETQDTSPPGARRQAYIYRRVLLLHVYYMPPRNTICHTGVFLHCSSPELTFSMNTAAPCCCMHRAPAATNTCVRRAGDKLYRVPPYYKASCTELAHSHDQRPGTGSGPSHNTHHPTQNARRLLLTSLCPYDPLLRNHPGPHHCSSARKQACDRRTLACTAGTRHHCNCRS